MKSQFRSLQKQSHPHSTLIFGAPAPLRNGFHTGNATGVAQNARTPFHLKEEEGARGPLFCTGRYLFSIFVLPNSTFIRVISIYAYAGATQLKKDATAALFKEVHTILLSLPQFPTIILGDFNCDPSTTKALSFLETEKWTDAVSLFTGPQIPTFKSGLGHTSTIDFVFVNHLLAPSVRSATVQPITSFGHAPIFVTFHMQHTAKALMMTPNIYLPLVSKQDIQSFAQLPIQENHVFALHQFYALVSEGQHHKALDLIQDLSADFLSHAHHMIFGTKHDIRRGTQHFRTTSQAVNLKAHKLHDNTFIEPLHSKYHAVLAKQHRRLNEIIKYIQHSEYDHAALAISKLNRCVNMQPDFITWLRSKAGLPKFLIGEFDVSPWLYVLHVFEHYIKTYVAKRKQFLFKQQKKDHMQDWQKGGKQLYASLKPLNNATRCSSLILSGHIPANSSIRVRQNQRGQPMTTFKLSLNHTPVFKQGSKVLVPTIKGDYYSFPSNSLSPDQDIDMWTHTSNGHELANAFTAEWSKFWCRSLDIQNPDIESFLVQMQPHFPPHAGVELTFTTAQWMQALKSMKTDSARGSDFWSVNELQSLPFCFHQAFAHLFQSMLCAGTSFPEHFCTTIISMIPKTDTPASLSDFRPISLFPIIQRVWSRVLYRQLMTWFSSWSDKSIRGFVPHGNVQTISYDIAFHVEQAIHTNEPIQGVILDITKCFDCMPREYAFAIMQAQGCPPHFISQWASLQALNKKYCRVNKCLSNPIHTTNGYGQGDSLSILPLLFLGQCFSSFISKAFPCQVYIYADNFSILTNKVEDIPGILRTALEFLDSWMLHVDLNKTVAWSTSSKNRALLKTILNTSFPRVKVLNDTKDLGSHLCFDRRFHSTTVRTRFDKFAKRLESLEILNVSQDIKIKAFRQAALPLLFFNPGLHFYSKELMLSAAQAVSKAMHLTMMHRSLPHALATLGHNSDPHFILHKERIFSMRKFLLSNVQWAEALYWTNTQPQGPISLFLQSLQFFGMQLLPDLFLKAKIHSFHLLNSAKELIFHLMIEAWERNLTEHTISARNKQVEGIIDTRATARALSSFPHDDTSLLRTIMALRNNTGSALKHWQPHLANCQHCSMPDTWDHRLTQCPYYCTTCTTMAIYKQLPLSSFTKSFGWHHTSSHYDNIQVYLSTLTLPSLPFFAEYHDIFVDGSAQPSNNVRCRLASAALYFPYTNYHCSFVVPGPLQSSVRAELYAFCLALQCSHSCTIYTDCSYVCNQFKAILASHNFLPDTHVDLWSEIKCILAARGPANFKCVKVKAHTMGRKYCQHSSWTAANHVVDTLAKIANLRRPSVILTQWTALKRHYSLLQSTSRVVFQHMLSVFRVGEAISKSENAEHDQEQPTVTPDNAHSQQAQVTLPPSLPAAEEGTLLFASVVLPTVQDLRPSFLFGPRWGDMLIQYLSKLKWPVNEYSRSQSPPITFGELFLDFWLSTGFKPPICIRNGTGPRSNSYVFQQDTQPDVTTLTEHMTMWTKSLQSLCRLHHVEVIPGINSHFNTTWIHHRGNELRGRGVRHGPKSLLNPLAVAQWKNEQKSMYQDITQICQLPLGNAKPPFVLVLNLNNTEATFNYRQWFNEDCNIRRRALSLGQREDRSFAPAVFIQ
jgi:endonuclease/exonuclease/phosphatase family metal-dependent hydrolase/ribonuclease HI